MTPAGASPGVPWQAAPDAESCCRPHWRVRYAPPLDGRQGRFGVPAEADGKRPVVTRLSAGRRGRARNRRIQPPPSFRKSSAGQGARREQPCLFAGSGSAASGRRRSSGAAISGGIRWIGLQWPVKYNARMNALRTSPILARLVLTWFVLVLGVAGASPLVHPRAMEVVCSAGGVKIVFTDDGQPAQAGQHTLDCSLCLPAAVPAATASHAPDVPQPLAHALKPSAAAHIAALVGAPLPPRGPPALA